MSITPYALWKMMGIADKKELLDVMSRDRDFFSRYERCRIQDLATLVANRYAEKLPHLTDEMKALIESGEKVKAIRLYRTSYLPTPSLKDALSVADSYKDSFIKKRSITHITRWRDAEGDFVSFQRGRDSFEQDKNE